MATQVIRRTFAPPDQIIGSVCGLLGAFLISLNQGLELVAFVSWLISNIGWIVFSIRINSFWLFIMNVGFSITSVMGILNFWS